MNMYANEMHMMTWYEMHDTQANDKATTANNWKTPGTSVSGHYNTPPLREDLVPRSRMAPERKWKRKRRGKTKPLLRQTSEAKEPWKVKPFREKNTTEMNEVENTPLEKRNKEEQIRTALRLKRDARLDKMKELVQRADTPVKRISKERNIILTKEDDGSKRATSQCLRKK